MGPGAFPGGVPLASDLEVCAGRPAFLPNRDHHSAWVNTLALERAGIDARTPDPFAGRIERDEQHNPTGTLHDSAMGLIARVLPTTSSEELAGGFAPR
jgi:predicted amidohydrolase YtcJ